MNITYTISINGQKAVDIGYQFCKGACYHGIYNHGKRIAQLEVVLDEQGEYNGYPIKWVDVSYIELKNVNLVINQLRKLGFSECFAICYQSNEYCERLSEEKIINI